MPPVQRLRFKRTSWSPLVYSDTDRFRTNAHALKCYATCCQCCRRPRRRRYPGATRCREGSGCRKQLYDPRVEQENATKMSRLEQQLRRNQLRRKQLASMEHMARSQASQLRTTLDMLLAPDDLDFDAAGTGCVQRPQ